MISEHNRLLNHGRTKRLQRTLRVAEARPFGSNACKEGFCCFVTMFVNTKVSDWSYLALFVRRVELDLSFASHFHSYGIGSL